MDKSPQDGSFYAKKGSHLQGVRDLLLIGMICQIGISTLQSILGGTHDPERSPQRSPKGQVVRERLLLSIRKQSSTELLFSEQRCSGDSGHPQSWRMQATEIRWGKRHAHYVGAAFQKFPKEALKTSNDGAPMTPTSVAAPGRSKMSWRFIESAYPSGSNSQGSQRCASCQPFKAKATPSAANRVTLITARS